MKMNNILDLCKYQQSKMVYVILTLLILTVDVPVSNVGRFADYLDHSRS